MWGFSLWTQFGKLALSSLPSSGEIPTAPTLTALRIHFLMSYQF